MKEVKKAKNEWLQEKANKVEVAVFSSDSCKKMWKSLRELLHGRAGMRSRRSMVIFVRVLRNLLTAGKSTSIRY